MKKGVLFLATLLAVSAVWAQCDQCSPVSGEIIDFCYTHPATPGLCASFSQSSPTFHFENKARKKSPQFAFALPAGHTAASIPYLTGLAEDKKLKLTATDLLFMEHAIGAWQQVEGVAQWNPEIVFSGYTLLDSGLAYKVLLQGSGNLPKAGNTVLVHYTGYHADGQKFDSSLDRKQAFRFALGKGQVIKGWDKGIAIMNVGSRYLFRVPPEMAIGSRGSGQVIPPNSTLFFDVQLLAAE